MIRLFAFLFYLALINTSTAQIPDCQNFKEGRFIYPNLEGNFLTERVGKHQYSWKDGEKQAVWKVKWLSDCVYEITCIKLLQAFPPFVKGDKIRVTIVDTNEKCYSFTMIYFQKGSDNPKEYPLSTLCKEE